MHEPIAYTKDFSTGGLGRKPWTRLPLPPSRSPVSASGSLPQSPQCSAEEHIQKHISKRKCLVRCYGFRHRSTQASARCACGTPRRLAWLHLGRLGHRAARAGLREGARLREHPQRAQARFEVRGRLAWKARTGMQSSSADQASTTATTRHSPAQLFLR